MAELRRYWDENHNREYVVICLDAKEVDELMGDCKLVDKIVIEDDVTSWPTDRPLVQE